MKWVIGTLVLLVMMFSSRVKFEDIHTPQIQPQKGAFSIWFIIFAALFATAYSSRDSEEFHRTLIAALISCFLWTFAANTVWAAPVLIAATGFSYASAMLCRDDHFACTGPRLLAGWLTLASALSIIIHARKFWKALTLWEERFVLIVCLLLHRVCLHKVGGWVSAIPLVWAAMFSQKKIDAAVLLGASLSHML